MAGTTAGPSELGRPTSLTAMPVRPFLRQANSFLVSFGRSIFALNDCAS